MPLELSGSQRRDLRKALMSAFPRTTDLELMASDQLDLELGHVVGLSHSHEYVTHELVGWAMSEGMVARLLLGARVLKPDNPLLHQVAQQLGLTSTTAGRQTLEKLVSGNTTFVDVARWRTRLTRAELQVCRIDHHGQGVGTGFLVGPDLVLTNHHVLSGLIDQPHLRADWSCRFDLKLAPDGDLVQPGSTVALAADWLVAAQPHSPADLVSPPRDQEPTAGQLDFALLRLAHPVGDEAASGAGMAEPRGWVDLGSAPAELSGLSTVAILQHPNSMPLKLALSFDQVVALNPPANRVRYTVPTHPGSSGSPVFDSDWNLVALHHSGDPDSLNPGFNEGIPAHLIAALPAVATAIDRSGDPF